MARSAKTQRSVGEELPELAAKHGLSVRAVARAVEVDQSYLSRIITGAVPASGALAARLAEIFELPIDYFPEFRTWRLEEVMRADPDLRDTLYERHARPKT